MPANFTEDSVRSILNKIQDPDLDKSLEELNSVKNIEITGSLAIIDLEIIQPIQWVAEKINNACADALENAFPGIQTEINVHESSADTSGREFLKNVKNIIAVASGKGGVGKSAVASNLAGALSLSGAKVGILDGDVYGPSQPTMFGLAGKPFSARPTEDGQGVPIPNEKYGIKVASMGFALERDQAAIIRGPLLAGYFSALFEQLDWGSLDFLVFDLPPGTGDIQLTLTQKIPLTGAVVITTPQEIAVADVRRALAMFNRVNVEILGIVENMSYFTPPDMPDKKYYIFGEGGGRKFAEEKNVPFLGELPLDISMRESNDGGKPIILNENAGTQGEKIKTLTAELVRQVRIHNYNHLNDSPDISL